MARVLLIGIGDLGRRIAFRLAESRHVSELVLAGRSPSRDNGLTALVRAAARREVRYRSLDATDQRALERLIREERPDLLCTTACVLSPWIAALGTRPEHDAFRRAGLGVQTAGQLVVPLTVMNAVRDVGYVGPVVNASYPDVVNPILGRLGRAPTIGVGNVSLIRSMAYAAWLEQEPEASGLLRVLGHHAHLDAVMHGAPGQKGESKGEDKTQVRANPRDPDRLLENRSGGPWVFKGPDGQAAHKLAHASPAVPGGTVRNELVAATAIPIIEALLPGGPARRTSAPAPMGLPGGYPIVINKGWISLDLPSRISVAEAVAVQDEWARGDGIERIDPDGTVHLTENAQSILATINPRLAEPLEPSQILQRTRDLREALG